MLEKAVEFKLKELQNILLNMSDAEYGAKYPGLENATLGQHFRHILELFECLLKGYETGTVDYDRRIRSLELESSRHAAITKLDELMNGIHLPDKIIRLTALSDSETVIHLTTNYRRELLYNLEHMIHHEAIMKIGLKQCVNISLPPFFGYAPSTIKYLKNQPLNSN